MLLSEQDFIAYQKKAIRLLSRIRPYGDAAIQQFQQAYFSILKQEKTKAAALQKLYIEFAKIQQNFYQEWTPAKSSNEELLIQYLIPLLQEIRSEKNKDTLLPLLHTCFTELLQEKKLATQSNNLLAALLQKLKQQQSTLNLNFPEELANIHRSPVIHFINAELKHLLYAHYKKQNEKNSKNKQKSTASASAKKVPVLPGIIQSSTENKLIISKKAQKILFHEIIYNRKKAVQSNSYFITLYLRALWLYLGKPEERKIQIEIPEPLTDITLLIEKNIEKKRQTEITEPLTLLIEKNFAPAKHLYAIRLGSKGHFVSNKGEIPCRDLLLQNIDYFPSLLALADFFIEHLNETITKAFTLTSAETNFFLKHGNDILWRLYKLAPADSAAKNKFSELTTLLNKPQNSTSLKNIKYFLSPDLLKNTLPNNAPPQEISFAKLAQKPRRLHKKSDAEIIAEEADFFLSIFPGFTLLTGFSLGLYVGSLLGTLIAPGIGTILGTIIGGLLGPVLNYLVLGNLGQWLIRTISSGVTHLLDRLSEKYDIHLPLEDKRTLLAYASWGLLLGAILGGLIPNIPIIGNAVGILVGSLLGSIIGATGGFVALTVGKSLGLKSSDMLSSVQRAIAGGLLFGFGSVTAVLIILFFSSIPPAPLIIMPVMAASILFGGLLVGAFSILYDRKQQVSNTQALPEKHFFDSAYAERRGTSVISRVIVVISWASMLLPAVDAGIKGIFQLTTFLAGELAALTSHLQTTLNSAAQATLLLITSAAAYVWGKVTNLTNKPKHVATSQMDEVKSSNPQNAIISKELSQKLGQQTPAKREAAVTAETHPVRSSLMQKIDNLRPTIKTTSFDTRPNFFKYYGKQTPLAQSTPEATVTNAQIQNLNL